MQHEHPEWFPPSNTEPATLKIWNSLTSSKVPFVPNKGNQVKWYICGPTVYDASHLGHARAYITFDIIRRIMSDYFNYDVFYTMNITDIDDKIIMRARKNHLLSEYGKNAKFEAVQRDLDEASKHRISELEEKIRKSESEIKEKKPTGSTLEHLQTTIAQDKLQLDSAREEQLELRELGKILKGDPEAVSKLLKAGASLIGDSLDRKLGHTLPASTVRELCFAHARKWEKDFFQDMRALGVRDPDVLTRVTEYVEQVVQIVQDIIKNKYGYESKGSVYFDTVKFSKERSYAKLCPWYAGNLSLVAEGEGALSEGGDREKRNASDFALWKKSKPGEPAWDSPWGHGRPGWHIECSAMATDLLGSNFDIHSGGEDLRFPHHDNELAQSEAASGSRQWVNYFLHAGHLNIQGLKMSKSLKNFITIKEVLKRYSARQIRLLFLLQSWDKKMNYNEDSLAEALAKEKLFREFFANAGHTIRDARARGGEEVWGPLDREVSAALEATQHAVHQALSDSFDFPTAMDLLAKLVAVGTKYMSSNAKALLLEKMARYVDKILRVFGVMGDREFGFSESAGGELLEKSLDAFTAFRDQVREVAFGKRPATDLLALCDALRDDIMPELGVRMEDRTGAPSLWKLDDPNVLIKERDERKRLSRENALKKLQNQLTTKQKQLAKYQSDSVPAAEFMAAMEDKYSIFDQKGVPTHDSGGKELSKKQLQQAVKQWEKQAEAHSEYKAKLAANPNLIPQLKAEIEALQLELQSAQAF